MSQSSAPANSSDLRARFPRVAITHEWLTVPGGSEKVVLALLDLLPHAELFTTVYDPAPWPPAITDRPVHTTFLDRIPSARRHYARLLPLMNRAWRRVDLSGFDLVISSSHACAKNVRVPDGVPHVSYCHTPMRYAWDAEFIAVERLGPLSRAAFSLVAPGLRRADRRSSRGVDRFAASSTFVAGRIAAAYGRDATVVHPPVDVERFASVARAVPGDAPYLVFGRLVPYKRADVAIEACLRLGRELVVAGDGRDADHLVRLAGRSPLIRFERDVDDERAVELLASSRALLFPGIEDFGIVPVEAQAAGLPVIAFGTGGARDTVEDGVTGVLYDDASPAGLAAAIERFESLRLQEAILREHASRFAPRMFAERFAALLATVG